MTSRTSTLGILLRHAGSHRSSPILLALLVCVAVLVLGIAPRALVVLADSELAGQRAGLTPTVADLTATGTTGRLNDLDGTADGTTFFGDVENTLNGYPKKLPKPFGDLLAQPEWYASFSSDKVEPRDPSISVESSLILGFDLEWSSRVRFVDGAEPGPWKDTLYRDVPPNELEPMDIAISRNAATTMELKVGDIVDSSTLPLRISGIFEAVDPADPYWQHAGQFLTARPTLTLSNIILATAGVYANPDSAVGMAALSDSMRVTAWFPSSSVPLAYDDLPVVIDQARQAASLGLDLPTGASLTVQTTLPIVLQKVQAKVTALTALLALSASAPLGMVLAVVVLGIRTVILRRRAAITLASARGMRDLRLRGVMALEGLAIALPATVIATIGAILLVPGENGLGLLGLPLLATVLTALTFGALTSPSGLREERTDVSAAPQTHTRVIAEAVIVGLTALAVFLLSSRGLVAASESVGVDPLLAATPLLLALTVCVIVLRLYPFPLLWLQRRMRRRRGAVGLLGSARAVRDPALGFASVLAIIIGVSAAVFSLVLVSTVTTGLDVAAHETVGGDIRLDAASLTADNLADVDAVPGVAEATPVQLLQGAELIKSSRAAGVTVLIADTASLHVGHPTIPDLSGEPDAVIRVLVSTDIGENSSDNATLNDQKVSIVGSIDPASLPVAPTAWVLVDSDYADRLSAAQFAPQQLFITVTPGSDMASVAAAVSAAVPDSSTLTTASLVAEATALPSIVGVNITLIAGALVSLLLGVLTIVLGSVAAASSRARAVGVMRLLGMPMRRSRALVAWELAPVTISSVLAGTALGLALPYLVTALVDLRDFVGGAAEVTPTVPVVLVVGATVGFALVVLLVGAIASARGRRSSLATTARMGAE